MLRALYFPCALSEHSEAVDRGVTRAERPAATESGEARAVRESPLSGDPTDFGPYRVTGRVGVGGMGIVHRVVHRESGVEAALKTVRVIDPALLASLRREVRALSRLRHPGIVRILDVGLQDATPWYAMELLQGTTLRRLLRGNTTSSDEALTLGAEEQSGAVPSGARPTSGASRPPPPLARRLELLRGMAPLCDALAVLHGEGVIHLDLTPDNVFVTKERPVLMDFGLAARSVAGHGRENLEVVSRGLGTVSYIAPEQLRGDVVDARADLYALGCILYEIVTGEPPFSSDSTVAIAYSHLELPPAPPSERAEDVPSALEALILALLEKPPHNRPGYAADVARELRAILPDAPARASGPGPRDYLYRPPMVCRAEPLEVLRADLSKAREGTTRLVLLGGESGVGKTRLAAEVARSEAGGELSVLTGECASLGIDEAHGAPLAPLTEVFHTIADRCRERGATEIENLLGVHGPLLSAFAPELKDLGGEGGWDAPEPLPARAARARLVRASVDALVALARAQPLILIVDDVQWADDLTMEVLRIVASEADTLRAPLLVIATYRSDETTPELRALLDTPSVTSIVLGRLDGAGARSMMDGMLGRAELPPAMVERVREHAEGNPFFIAEYLRAAVREKVLYRVEGRWTAADVDGAKVAALPLPRSIQDLVSRRLDRLGVVARQIAEVAAVIGRDLSLEELPRLVPVSEADLSDALLELVATQMHEPLPDGRLRFVHAKLHEGVYGSLPTERRSALHRAVAAGIEESAARPGRAALLAHHYLAAGPGAVTSALDALESAALESLGNGSYSAAETFLERARALTEQHGLVVPPLRRARWERGLGDCRFALGDLGRAAAHGRAALTILGHTLPAGGLGATLAVLRESTVSALTRTAEGDEAAALVEASLGALRVAEAGYYQLDAAALLGGSVLSTTLAARAGAEVRAAKAYAMLGVVVSSLGMRGASTRLSERAIRGAEGGDDKAALAFTLYAKALNDVAYCDFAAGRLGAQRASDLARGMGDEYDAGVAETILGHAEYWSGDLLGSARRYQRLAQTARSVRATQHEAWGLYAEARALLHTSACERAVELCREAQSKLVGQNDAASELISEALLGWALLGVGGRAEAIEAATAVSAKIARSSTAIWPNMPGYAAVIEVWLAVADTEPAALAHAERAQKALAGLVMGAPLAESTAKLYAGRISAKRGARARAERELSAAVEVATKRGIPLDEGLARLALSSLLVGERAAAEAQQGNAILARIGATRHLAPTAS